GVYDENPFLKRFQDGPHHLVEHCHDVVSFRPCAVTEIEPVRRASLFDYSIIRSTRAASARVCEVMGCNQETRPESIVRLLVRVVISA
ncbi:MAG TPA: hypothetical protein PLS99_09995, partial [Thermotogota bacterium]|nr:hypothetical protein [Thermotogota bacterium]